MPRIDADLSLLRRVPGLGGLTDVQLAALAGVAEDCEIPEGTVLMREGAVGRQSFIVVEGWAAVSVGGAPVAVAGPGQYLGGTTRPDHGRRTATVIAKTPMRLLVIGPEAISAAGAIQGEPLR